MQADSEGFLYPIVNEADCIDCGLCEKVCHEVHPYEERKPQKVYAAINKDEQVRMNSSSGGIFYLLAEKTIKEGGVVFGARFDDHWQVIIDYAETFEGVKAFMGSKYVQAQMESAYSDAKRFLQEGRKVLFSGTPCQIAGLHHFLRKPYDNLLTVDIICHGTPSPKVWSRYLDEVVTAGRKAINDIQFRNKRNGWKNFSFAMLYNKDEDTVSLCCQAAKNHYMHAFLNNLILRPSCHHCQSKEGRSHSDITIADFWNVSKIVPEMDDDKGTGLVLINSQKGYKTFEWSKITHKETTAKMALRHNIAFNYSVTPHPKRMEFFSRMDQEDPIISLIVECLRPTLKKRFRMVLSFCKQQIIKMLNLGGGNSIQSKNEIVPETLIVSDTSAISAITFRSKLRGWRSYGMDIKIKARKQA